MFRAATREIPLMTILVLQVIKFPLAEGTGQLSSDVANAAIRWQVKRQWRETHAALPRSRDIVPGVDRVVGRPQVEDEPAHEYQRLHEFDEG